MTAVIWTWIVAAAVLFVSASLLGRYVIKRGVLGILIDTRGRYSLTQLQLAVWTVVVLSLIAAVATGRLLHGAAGGALGFAIPEELLVVMGISVGSTVAATVVKTTKDTTSPSRIAAADPDHPPRFWQVFLVEEGAQADQVIDITKFQNFWITLLLVVVYVSLTVTEIRRIAPADLSELPRFSGTFLTLLGISHAAYVAGKLPSRQGEPRVNLSMTRAGDPA